LQKAKINENLHAFCKIAFRKNFHFCKSFCKAFLFCESFRKNFSLHESFCKNFCEIFVFTHVLQLFLCYQTLPPKTKSTSVSVLDTHAISSWIRIHIPNEKFSQKLSRKQEKNFCKIFAKIRKRKF
jgi:hypothetical protein